MFLIPLCLIACSFMDVPGNNGTRNSQIGITSRSALKPYVRRRRRKAVRYDLCS